MKLKAYCCHRRCFVHTVRFHAKYTHTHEYTLAQCTLYSVHTLDQFDAGKNSQNDVQFA